MIHEVDETIRALMRRDLLNGSNVEISFDAPTKDWSARQNTPTVNFYLYDIQEDLDRRDVQQRDVRGQNGLITERKMPPRFFKLSYLVTAWTQRPEDEHRLLSGVLSTMVASDSFPEDVLQGSLADAPQPIKTTVALPLPEDRSISDVWSALGGELKPSLDLIVTVPFELGRPEPVGALVTEEPRITLVSPDGTAEEAGGRAGETKEEAEPKPPSQEEVVHGGKATSGRTFTFKGIPRK